MDYSKLGATLDRKAPGVVFDVAGLYARCQSLADSRKAKGKQYSLAFVLVAFSLAKMAGADTPRAIASWVKLRGALFVEAFQLKRACMPHHDTYRRVLGQVVELAALERITSAFTQALVQAAQPAEWSGHIALDGKTMRGTHSPESPRGVHLLAAYVPQQGVVLFQVAVGDKTNEIGAAPTVLKALDLQGKVITGDAMFAQRDLSSLIGEAGGHFIWTIKDNQPATRAAIEKLFEPQPPPRPGHTAVPTDFQVAQTIEKQRGRVEHRTLTTSAMLEGYLTWPGLRQVFRIERVTTVLATGKTRREVAYGLTSLPPQQADPAHLLRYVRAHWGIENGLHYRRDITLREDALRSKSSRFAQGMALINNLVVALACTCAFDNLAEARRTWDAHPDQALALLL